MSDGNTIAVPQTDNSLKMLYAMVGIGILCALLIVMTYEGTKPRIERLRAIALEKAIFEVIPGATNMNRFVWSGDTFERLSQGSDQQVSLYAGYNDEGQTVGMAIEASGQGYADIIRVLYGYDFRKQQIVGFQVLETKETPGLGDKIEKDPAFLANFNALDAAVSLNTGQLLHAIETVKQGAKTQAWEVDGITGATISSRAIGDILNQSAQKWAPKIQRNLEAFNQ